MLSITGLLLLLSDKSKENKQKSWYQRIYNYWTFTSHCNYSWNFKIWSDNFNISFTGVDKEKSARFSFLMVVPLIFGKMIKDILSGEINLNNSEFSSIFGFVAALITGLFACKWMISLVKNSNLKYFAFYCFTVSFIVIIFFFFMKPNTYN